MAYNTIARNTGARGLRSVLEGRMTDIMYDIPSDRTVEKVVITKETIEDAAPPRIVRNPAGRLLSAKRLPEKKAAKKRA